MTEDVEKTINFFTVGIWGKYHMYKKNLMNIDLNY